MGEMRSGGWRLRVTFDWAIFGKEFGIRALGLEFWNPRMILENVIGSFVTSLFSALLYSGADNVVSLMSWTEL
jgi:hypothetical protein